MNEVIITFWLIGWMYTAGVLMAFLCDAKTAAQKYLIMFGVVATIWTWPAVLGFVKVCEVEFKDEN